LTKEALLPLLASTLAAHPDPVYLFKLMSQASRLLPQKMVRLTSASNKSYNAHRAFRPALRLGGCSDERPIRPARIVPPLALMFFSAS
jgi:hypothetical protein